VYPSGAFGDGPSSENCCKWIGSSSDVSPVHGGVPGSRKSDSKSLDAFWMSSSDLKLLRMRREREFKDQGVEVSTTLLANSRGTPEDAARAVEHAAQRVLDAHTSGLGGLIQSKNQSVKVDLRDLEKFNQMLQKENIGTLQKGLHDYWSDERRQDHRLRSEKGGASKKGRMTLWQTTCSEARRAEAPRKAA